MDSLTQIVLGAAVGEAVAGKKMGNRAPFWGAIAGTIPDLDVFLRNFYHPIDAALVHRGFSHSILFAVLFSPVFGWLCYRLYKRKNEYQLWVKLFFWGIITHPMLDIFTNYGTSFFYPFDVRVTFNTVFVIDPLYTVPFGLLLLIVLFLKRDNPLRRKLNKIGIIYSCLYLLWGVMVKLYILNQSDQYFKSAGIKAENTMVTPMPLTSFYWMMLTETDSNYYIGYKSLFYEMDPSQIDTFPKNHKLLAALKWPDKNYTPILKHISNGYYSMAQNNDSCIFYDLRFGSMSSITDGKEKQPLMGYLMLTNNGIVQKTSNFRSRNGFKNINFDAYYHKIFSK